LKKLLGIAIIRGWDSSDNHMLKAFCLIQNDENIDSKCDICLGKHLANTIHVEEFMQDIRLNIGKRKLEDEKLKLYQYAMERLENNKIDTHSFRGVYKDYTEADLRASFPTTKVLEYLLELEK
jgi:hypothetical protein